MFIHKIITYKMYNKQHKATYLPTTDKGTGSIMKITVKANAKINLFLDIVSQREDKYHNILSLMQSVDLFDTVTVEYLPSEQKQIQIFCNRDSVPCDSRNLAFKAAEKFLSNGMVKIMIDKKIPSEAGLAGGSADAAATLLALNKLADNKLSLEELKKIGATIGADVPFCIEGGTCLVEGIGDIMIKSQPMPCFPIVIARKGEGMSTPEAYRKLDEKYNCFNGYKPNTEKLRILTEPLNIKSAEQYCKGLFNIFESIVEEERPDITKIKRIMSSCGSSGEMMSGSGTSVFGVFQNEELAKKALSDLADIGAVAYLCYPRSSGVEKSIEK